MEFIVLGVVAIIIFYVYLANIFSKRLRDYIFVREYFESSKIHNKSYVNARMIYENYDSLPKMPFDIYKGYYMESIKENPNIKKELVDIKEKILNHKIMGIQEFAIKNDMFYMEADPGLIYRDFEPSSSEFSKNTKKIKDIMDLQLNSQSMSLKEYAITAAFKAGVIKTVLADEEVDFYMNSIIFYEMLNRLNEYNAAEQMFESLMLAVKTPGCPARLLLEKAEDFVIDYWAEDIKEDDKYILRYEFNNINI